MLYLNTGLFSYNQLTRLVFDCQVKVNSRLKLKFYKIDVVIGLDNYKSILRKRGRHANAVALCMLVDDDDDEIDSEVKQAHIYETGLMLTVLDKELIAPLYRTYNEGKIPCLPNPKKFKDAKFIPEISWKDFDKMANKQKFKPGQHFVLDQTASKIIRKNKIKTYILGENMKQLDNLLHDRKFRGTVIGS